MEDVRNFELPSGAELQIRLAPFADSNALYQAVLVEVKSLSITNAHNTEDLVKNLFCGGFSSPQINTCLWKCFDRVTYSKVPGQPGARVDKNTFEPSEARQDYVSACMEVLRDNIAPFLKGLFAQLKTLPETIAAFQK